MSEPGFMYFRAFREKKQSPPGPKLAVVKKVIDKEFLWGTAKQMNVPTETEMEWPKFPVNFHRLFYNQIVLKAVRPGDLK